MENTLSYKKVARYFKNKKITIVEKNTADSSYRYVRDPNGYLNEDGEYTEKPVWGTIDLSSNGCNFNESTLPKILADIQLFYETQISTFDDFSKWIETISTESEEA